MADKSLETDESLNTDSKYTNHNNHSYSYNKSSKGVNVPITPVILQKQPPQQHEEALPPTNHLNILQEKIMADEANKICPMCGKLYDSTIPFESFCEHVEEHFRDESLDLVHSMENNFEFISHTVGDF